MVGSWLRLRLPVSARAAHTAVAPPLRSVALTLVLALCLSACGGGGSSANTGGVPVVITSVEPSFLDSEIATELVVRGSGFGLPGPASLSLVAEGTTRFLGDASDRQLLPCEVISDTEIRCDSLCAGARGEPFEATIGLVTTDDRSGVSALPLLTIIPPSVVSISPEAAVASLTQPFEITGEGFGPLETRVQVRFSALGTPFHFRGTGELRVEGFVASPTRIVGRLPSALIRADVEVREVAVEFPSGAEMSLRGEAGAFRFVGPTIQQLLEAPIGDRVGSAVAIDGDTVAVSALEVTQPLVGDRGVVRIYVRSDAGWTLQQELRPDAGTGFTSFGAVLALQDDTLLVAAPRDRIDADRQGSVYVFERLGDEWARVQRITAPPGAANINFGSSIALDGDDALVGLPLGGTDMDYIGLVWCLRREGTAGWQHAQLITAPRRERTFGFRVALDGDRAVMGAPYAGGILYAFHRIDDEWVLVQELTTDLCEEPQPLGSLGAELALRGDELVAGAPSWRDGDVSVGRAYVFVATGMTWTKTQTIAAVDSSINVGAQVALTADHMYMAARHGNEAVDLRVYARDLQGRWILQGRGSVGERRPRTGGLGVVGASDEHVVLGLAGEGGDGKGAFVIY